MKLARRWFAIGVGVISVFSLVACQDQVPTEAKAPKVPEARVHASVMGTRIGNAIDIGYLGSGAGWAPVIAENGDISGNMYMDATGSAHDGVFWSPGTGLMDIGVPTGCQQAWVNGINASDQVVGFAVSCPSNTQPVSFQDEWAFRWSPTGGFQILSPPTSSYTIREAAGFAINKDGVVAGTVFSSLARWDASGNVEVAQFDASCVNAEENENSPPAIVINDAGQIAGDVGCSNTTGERGFFWSPGSAPQIIGTLGGDHTYVTGINNHGTVVGYSATADGKEHPFRWTSDGGLQDLGLPGTGGRAWPAGVADDESIAGWYDEGLRSWRWTPSSGMQDLGLLPNQNPANPYPYLMVYGISPTGMITGSGSGSDNGEHAFRWSTTYGPEDLGVLAGGITRGMSVNSAGQVAGFYFPPDGFNHWVRWDAPSSTTTQLATLTLSNLQQIYDGTPKLATVTTSPADLTGVTITYSQGGTAVPSPINAGSYDVVAMLTNASYTAPQVTGTLVIARAAQTITFGAIPNHSLGDPPFSVSATGGASGNPVTFATTTPAVCTVAGSTVTLLAIGTCTIDASQAGTANYAPASDVARSFQVTLPFSGFLPPLAGTALHLANAGAGVAINFTLGGDRGLNVLAAGSPSSAPVSCSSGAVLGAATPAQSAGNAGLQYDATTGEYTYVWKTDRSWSGSCRTLSLSLIDGSTYQARFQFR